MENCTLHLTIPRSNSTWDVSGTISSPSTIDIWVLDSSKEINRHVLWDHAPLRQYRFATVNVSPNGLVEPLPFYCPSSSFSTFELACSDVDPDCRLEFWQRKHTSPNGERANILIVAEC